MIIGEYYNYQNTRQESEDIIKRLEERYPKAFFTFSRKRRPLKIGIQADLEKDGFPATPAMLKDALHWYCNSFGYLYAVTGGAVRVDLQGKSAGFVTDEEAEASRDFISRGIEYNESRQRRQDIFTMREAGRSGLTPANKPKLHPSLSMPELSTEQSAAIPEIERLRKAFDTAIASLNALVAETQSVIADLNQKADNARDTSE